MTEIRCSNCNHCLAKDVKVGMGMYYVNPTRVLELYQDTKKCPNCGALIDIIHQHFNITGTAINL